MREVEYDHIEASDNESFMVSLDKLMQLFNVVSVASLIISARKQKRKREPWLSAYSLLQLLQSRLYSSTCGHFSYQLHVSNTWSAECIRPYNWCLRIFKAGESSNAVISSHWQCRKTVKELISSGTLVSPFIIFVWGCILTITRVCQSPRSNFWIFDSPGDTRIS